MQTVVLAAGQGTRMRPLTDERPKPMLPVGDRPLLEHVLDAAVSAGASRLVVVVGYEADVIRDHFGATHRGVPIEWVLQEDQAGTAHAVRVARSALREAPFVVLAGDNLYDEASLGDLFESTPAIGAYRVENPRPYGVFELEDGAVVGLVEKPDQPPSNLVNTSAYAFTSAALEWLDVPESDRGEHELTDVAARQIETDSVTAVEFERWLDVGRPWELLEATEWKVDDLPARVEGDVHESAVLNGPVTVAAGASVRAGVVIDGPVYVGPDASVGPNAYLRARAAIGPSATVGSAVEIKNSVLMEGAAVPHQSYVGDSVLGRRVNLGAGTQVANLRHDDQPVRVTVKGERLSTGRRKFGVVLGDGAKTGINTTLNAGVTLRTQSATEPGEVVLRDR